MVRGRARRRLQHAARAGARPRRRVLSTARSSRAPPSSRGCRRRSIRSPTTLDARARGRSRRCTPGSTSTWWRAPSTCRRRAQHVIVPPPRVADGAARARRRRCAASIRAARSYVGRLARVDARARVTRSRDSTSRRSTRAAADARRRGHRRPRVALRTRRHPPRLRALSRATTSTTAAARSPRSAGRDRPHARRPTSGATRRRARRATRWPTPIVFPERWARVPAVAPDGAGDARAHGGQGGAARRSC